MRDPVARSWNENNAAKSRRVVEKPGCFGAVAICDPRSGFQFFRYTSSVSSIASSQGVWCFGAILPVISDL